MITLSETQKDRYSRHIMLSEIGESGQKKLLGAKILVVGLGGLGSPVGYYLAAAGIGHLGIIDPDVVDISNLQRQILHSTPTIGVPKPDSAEKTIVSLNPDVKITKHAGRLTAENAADIVRDYDIVIDACDNLPTRYVMNDACQAENKPLVHGSIFQFEGRATVFLPGEGPCYRCLYLEPPPADMMPGPTDIGLLGVLPGVIGVVEATEAIKLILGLGESLVGKLLIYDALSMEFQKLNIRKNPDCPVCNG
ncbi:molybdopterin-synthase adenylyltransferase MoeB [Candidatus Poribacteria bacterium]